MVLLLCAPVSTVVLKKITRNEEYDYEEYYATLSTVRFWNITLFFSGCFEKYEEYDYDEHYATFPVFSRKSYLARGCVVYCPYFRFLVVRNERNTLCLQ